MSEDMFDLDIQVSKTDDLVQPNITSVSLCTPGTCIQKCRTNTFASRCCPSRYNLCFTR